MNKPQPTVSTKITDLFSVQGKVAIVTGGSRGIGAMIAQGLVENGVKTYITSRKAEECQQTAEALSEFGECIALPFDLATLDGITGFVKAFTASEKQLDILVNNAGATWGAPLATYPESGWDKVLDLNLKSPFFLVQQLLPQLKAAASPTTSARIINIASINALAHPHMDNYAYTASKAGIIYLTKHLAGDLASENITVNAIAPGFFPSKMTAHLEDHIDEIAKAIPCGRIGSVTDITGTAIYLSSAASSWVTGVTIPVDGGMVANA